MGILLYWECTNMDIVFLNRGLEKGDWQKCGSCYEVRGSFHRNTCNVRYTSWCSRDSAYCIQLVCFQLTLNNDCNSCSYQSGQLIFNVGRQKKSIDKYSVWIDLNFAMCSMCRKNPKTSKLAEKVIYNNELRWQKRKLWAMYPAYIARTDIQILVDH